MIDEAPYDRPTPESVCSWAGYLYFVWEREVIRIVHDESPSLDLNTRPYTRDPILARYRFTNIRRRDDRTSRWIIEHLIKPNLSDPDLWFRLLIARLINWPPTLRRIRLPARAADFDPVELTTSLEAIKRELGVKVFGAAYMIYPTRLEPGRSKAYSVAHHILRPAAAQSDDIRDALARNRVAAFTERLAQCFGISTFMAGQVAADLTYCPQLGDATDLYTWAPLGPGSQLGLNLLHGCKPTRAWAQVDFNSALQTAREHIVRELEIDDLTLHDVQNTFCEFSKYVRALQGTGRPKSHYHPETEY